EPKHILALILRNKKFPHAANKRLGDLKKIFKWLKKHRYVSDNPAADVEKLLVPDTDGFHPWSDLKRRLKHPPDRRRGNAMNSHSIAASGYPTSLGLDRTT